MSNYKFWPLVLMPIVLAAWQFIPDMGNAQPAKRDACFQVSSSEPQAVIDACSAFLDQQPTKGSYERALNRRGLAYYRTQRNKEALSDFNSLVVSNPTSAGYLDNRRAVYQAMGQYENALVDADKVIQLVPRRAWGYHNRANLYFEMGRYDDAYRDYTTAFELPEATPYLFSLYDRGRVLAKTKKHERAVADFTAVYKADANFLYALRERALSLIELGRMEEAERDLVVFLERERDEPEATAALGRLRSAIAAGAPGLAGSDGGTARDSMRNRE